MRTRLRRIARWTCTLLSIALLSLWIISQKNTPRRILKPRYPSNETRIDFRLLSGRAWIFGSLPLQWSTRWEYAPPPEDPEVSTRYFMTREPPGGPIWPAIKTSKTCVSCSIPLWLPVLLLAAPTALLWYRDRRGPLEGHCPNCNYNLTANESGKCPECGTPTPNSEPAARAPGL